MAEETASALDRSTEVIDFYMSIFELLGVPAR
jgi:hypothetical protein